MELQDDDILHFVPEFMRSDPAVISLAAWTSGIVRRLFAQARLLTLWDKIDSLMDAELDELAWALDISWYASSAPHSEKVSVIRCSEVIKARIGTPFALETVMQSVLGSGTVIEWYEYGGDPYHFKLLVNAEDGDPANPALLRLLNAVKRESAWFDGLEAVIRISSAAYIGTGIVEESQTIIR